jgi:hypothetical protein
MDFKRETNSTLIYGDEEDDKDQLEAWIRKRSFVLDESDSLVSY